MKKILYIDMDGVIANFEKAINKHCPNFSKFSENKKNHLVDTICKENPNLFYDLEPIEGSIEAVNKLFSLYEVYFLSTPLWSCPESFSGKRVWIENNFGKIAKKRLILTHRKDLNIGDYLIDDRIHNGAGKFKGIHIHFGTEKFPNWDSVLNLLI